MPRFSFVSPCLALGWLLSAVIAHAQTPPAPLPAALPAPSKAVAAPARAEPPTTPGDFRISGFVQAQFQHDATSEDQLQQSGSPSNRNEFLLRRARLRIDREWRYAAATLELDGSTLRGPRVGVRRAEAALLYRGAGARALPPLLMLSIGVLDIPFGAELLEATRLRWFMERSTGSSALFPSEMDVGAKLSGGAKFLRYALAVMNGEPLDEGALPRDPNNAKDVIGRLGAEGTLTRGFSLSGGTSFAVGKGFHAGEPASKSRLIWNDVNQDGVTQTGEIVGVPGSAATRSRNFKRWAIGLDLRASLRSPLGSSVFTAEALVASNYDRGVMPSDPVSSTLDARQAGGYVALTQELGRYGIVGFRAAVYNPNADLLETRAAKLWPKTATLKTYSPLAGLVLPGRARLLFEYDFVRDYLGRDSTGVPQDLANDRWTVRLQVEL